MFKNNRGISVITLIITIIVLVIITSVTVFTGTKMISNSREKAWEDRLKTIYNAIVAHEAELGYGDTVPEKEITKDEYIIMGLDDYSDEENFTAVHVSKQIHSTDSTKRVYNLKLLKKEDTDDWYELDPIIYETGNDNINTKIEFDVKKGVNRPQILPGMIPLDTYVDNVGDIRTNVVNNVYTENWYDYSLSTPRWANMLLDDVHYVWIPRFAYKIQDFYVNKDYETVPNSAISIIFLKENSNYMANNEILPDGYQVHPAFTTSDGQELAGIWIAKYVYDDVDTLKEAANKSYEMYEGSTSIESHLMKSTEWAAMAYLSFASGGNSRDGNTLNNSYGICDINSPEFVAAGLNSANTFGHQNVFDSYLYVDDKLTYESNEEKKNGDALVATSSQLSENSAWYKGMSVLPNSTSPYLLRRGDISYFAYEAYNGTRLHTSYRNVITIIGSENVNNLSQIKVGDYVSYMPDTPASVKWRAWELKGNKVIIIPTAPVGKLKFGYENSTEDNQMRRIECFNDYRSAVTQIEALCDNYVSSTLGVTKTDVRSLTIDDLENARVSTLATQKMSYTNGIGYNNIRTCTSGRYIAARYNEETGKNDVSSAFIEASSTNPVKLKQTYYRSNAPGWKAISEDNSITYGNLLGHSSGWLSNQTIYLTNFNACFYIPTVDASRLDGINLFDYSGSIGSGVDMGVRPLIALNASLLKLNESDSGNGSSSSPWNIVKK
ncbi:MAG: hypothetical protein IKK43_05530 [Clostridia bacterium]|nr:hypothetical protein [Clostridia bacterium]